MQLYELLNELLELLIPCSEEKINKGDFYLNIANYFFKINDRDRYQSLHENILSTNKKLQSDFASSTLKEFIRNKLINYKIDQKYFDFQDNTNFFQELTSKQKQNLKFITTIPNIILDIKNSPINLGCFSLDIFPHEFKNGIKYPVLRSTTYLRLIINDVFDPLLASYKASSAFVDFIRIVLFITNRFDYKYHLQISNEQQQYDNNEGILNTRVVYNYYAYNLNNDQPITGRYEESIIKLHISRLLSTPKSSELHKVWDFYQNYHENTDLTDIQKRILSASLAVGESIRSEETNNSIIYTCIALESLFTKNREEGIRSIISKSLSFLVSVDQEQYDNYYKLTTQIYDARSTIVHGRQLSEIPDFNFINKLLRDAIIELLNNKKYKDIETIEQLSEIVRATKFHV